MRVRVRVPASTSNLGPGFDCLGLALQLYTTVEVESPAPGLALRVSGAEPEGIPPGRDNFVLRGLCHALGRPLEEPPALRIAIHNDIPVGRGLGSSGAAWVAGLVAGRLLAGDDVVPRSLLDAATRLEGHPDNVAPALLGGLVASAADAGQVHAVGVPLPAGLSLVLVIPDRTTSTQAARALLPSVVPFADAVHNVAHTALLLGALVRGDWELVRPALHDRLHQERRLSLVPGLAEALAALDGEPGCAGAVLSGSGPTLVGFLRDDASATGHAAAAVLARHGVPARVCRVRPELAGVGWELERGA
jgi:homoserine kinase